MFGWCLRFVLGFVVGVLLVWFVCRVFLGGRCRRSLGFVFLLGGFFGRGVVLCL